MESLKPLLKNGNIGPNFIIEGDCYLSWIYWFLIANWNSFKGIDPLDLGNVTIKQGYEMKLIGFKALGTSNYKIEKIRVNLENFKVCYSIRHQRWKYYLFCIKLDIVVNMPKVTTQANYALNWKLPLISLQGEGVAYSYLGEQKKIW